MNWTESLVCKNFIGSVAPNFYPFHSGLEDAQLLQIVLIKRETIHDKAIAKFSISCAWISCLPWKVAAEPCLPHLDSTMPVNVGTPPSPVSLCILSFHVHPSAMDDI
jgi:hypothetical protein